VRDIARHPPADWPLERKRAYFDWAKSVVDRMRGVHPGLEAIFDAAPPRGPPSDTRPCRRPDFYPSRDRCPRWRASTWAATRNNAI
jgi:hypothetical protein